MSLTLATLLMAVALLAFGGVLLWRGAAAVGFLRAHLRSQAAAGVLFGVAAAWFLYYVLNLGPADFGQYRHLLFILFGAVALSSFFYVKDFLAVRGGVILYLLIAAQLLQAAFGHWEIPQRLFLVTLVYAGIVAALYLGTVPYRMRDLLDWLQPRAALVRAAGGVSAGYGALLLVLALTY